METKATVILEVNGKQAVSQIDIIKSKLKDLCGQLDEAQKRNDQLSVKKYSQEIRLLEKRLKELEDEAIEIDDIISSMPNVSSLSEYSKITNIEVAKSFLFKRNSFVKNLTGLTLYDLGEEIERLLSLRGNIDFSKGIDHIFKNGFKVTLSSESDLDNLIDKLQKSLSDLINTFDWLKFNSSTLEKFKTSFSNVAPSDLRNYPGLQYDIHTELEQEKALHFVEFAAGIMTQLEMQVADLESEIKANERLLSQANISEKERHRLVTENLTKEKKLKQLLDQDLSKQQKELDEAEVQRRQEEIYARYDEELKSLKSMYESGAISYNSMVKKEQDYHIRMYQELLTVYKKGSYMHYDIQRNLASMLKKQMLDNVKEVDDAVKAIISRYFNASVNGENSEFRLGSTKFDLRTREEKEVDYNRNIDAIDVLRKRLIDSSNGDESKISKINKYMDHAARWEEIKYKRSIGEDPMLNWKEKLEDFNNWFKEDETQQIIAMVNNVASQIGGIFSNINRLIEIDLEVRLAKLTKYYDREISMAEGNSYKVKQLERKRDKEIANARKEASRQQLNYQVFQALAQTAQNAITAYGSGLQAPWPTSLWLAPMMAGLATTAGMVQLAVIYKQQQAVNSQGYQKGGFTPDGKENEPVGVVHAGEWVASQKLVKSPVVRPLLNSLELAQRNNTIPSLTPQVVENYFTLSSRDERLNNTLNLLTKRLDSLELSQYSQVAVMKRLNERLEEPFVTINTVTGDTGIKQAQDEYLRLMNNTLPKNKRKKFS